jgi:carboxymethylenebutenolidase
MDRSLRNAPAQLERVLSEVGIEHDIKVYPQAGHAFLNDPAPGELPLWARVAGGFANAGYHEPSAADARRRIVSFFNAHLKP